MPPLRWHKEDIPLLVSHFLKQRTPEGTPLPTIPGDVIDRLMEYNWPGNVRELLNEIRRYLTTGELELHAEALAMVSQPFTNGVIDSETKTYAEIIENVERRLLTKALALHQGSRVKTAEALQIPLRSLHRKIKQYQL